MRSDERFEARIAVQGIEIRIAARPGLLPLARAVRRLVLVELAAQVIERRFLLAEQCVSAGHVVVIAGTGHDAVERRARFLDATGARTVAGQEDARELVLTQFPRALEVAARL